jgi:hypothetical protein
MNVILLPSTPSAQPVCDQLMRWLRAGLCRPFCSWVANATNTVEVRYADERGVQKLALPRALELEGTHQPRFLAFYPLVDPHERVEESFAELVERFLGRVAAVLDFQVDGPPTCTLAIAPATVQQRIPPGIFRANWEGLVVAPEDRATPGAANTLVDNDAGLTAHAAHALVTIAGLWLTPAGNKPDLIEQLRGAPAGALPVTVRVVRCFSRSVELGYVADHVAASALHSNGGWPRPDAERFDRARDSQTLLVSLAQNYLNKHANVLLTRPFEEIHEDAPQALTLVEALRMLADRLIALIERRPFELAEEAIAALHDKAAAYVERIAGPESGIRVRRWNELPERERGLPQLRRRIDVSLTVADGRVSETWSDLRTLVLGLVDGSQLPEGVGADALRRGSRRLVVCDPALLARDPGGGGDQEADVSLLGRIRVGMTTAASAARAHADALQEATDSSDEDTPDPDGATLAEAPAHGLRGMKPLLRRISGMGVAALVAMIGVWTQISLLAGLAASFAIGTLWLLASANACRRMLVRPRVEDDPRVAADLDALNRVLRLRQASADAVRLERRSAELDDWITILAELLHRPWVREQLGGLHVSPTVDRREMPSAFESAVALASAKQLELVGSRARAQAFSQGWLSSIYRAVNDSTMRQWALSQRLEDPPDPAADVSEDEESPRRTLVAAVIGGEGRRLADNPITRELLGAIENALLDELAPTVSRMAVADVQLLGPTTVWLAMPREMRSVEARRARLVLTVNRGAGVLAAPGLALSSETVLAGGHRAYVNGADGEEIEVREICRQPDGGLIVIRLDADSAGADASSTPALEVNAEPLCSSAFVALGPGEEGRTVARWGIVTRVADDLGVAFDGVPLSNGAPLFDLDGRLMGIYAGPGRAHRIKDLDALMALIEHGADGRAEEVLTLHEPPSTTSELPPMTASSFLCKIVDADPEQALARSYWSSHDGANRVALTLPASLALSPMSTRIGQLVGVVRFMAPLRLMVHLVQVTRPVAPLDLIWCTDTNELDAAA